MTLTRTEFDVLRIFTMNEPVLHAPQVAHATDLPPEMVEETLDTLTHDGFISSGRVTQKGAEALEPYRVDSAVILATDLYPRFAPISYEEPKGLLKVRGEILIERQIEQLQAAGITNITIAVGYKQECFFYLSAKYEVKLLVNHEYAERDNGWTLWLARELLGNTYLCPSDDYFAANPFERYVYKAYHASVYVEGSTDEWCLGTDGGERIVSASIGGHDSWVTQGHAYFDRAFSERFIPLLGQALMQSENESKPWESIYAENLSSLDMEIRRYSSDIIHEFNSLEELEEFEPGFVSHVSSPILDNITQVLSCFRADIHGFLPVSQGLTNLSFRFSVNGQEYVYRHPGIGTDKFIDRDAETQANTVAHRLGVDRTFLYEDSKQGWKICRFVRNARNLDPLDPTQVKRAMELCRSFHESGARINATFDFFGNGVSYESLLEGHGAINISGYYELREKVARISAHASGDGYPPCFSHNDYLPLNFLIDEQNGMDVIDWEFAGMSDPGNDFATFVICSQYDEGKAEEALSYYFGGTPTFLERRHFWAMVVLGGWCWYVWALEKDAEGAGVGEWESIYKSYAVDYVDRVLTWYEEGE
ncbi:phosphotransferase [Thermophilibacter immobilis]|uniref:Phosphotransferase n=1 Tax=Thermophilibacter immobilis TaxID=2779519 RepID=A0A7S7RVE8_9ACTN|nr:phosphotransferase [Thermophilibacter immobilis]